MTKLNSVDMETLEICVRLDGQKLFWKERPRSLFSSDKDCKRWNTTYAGKEAFCTKTFYGYLAGTLFKRHLFAHRVIWALHHKSFPLLWLDHIDGNRENNDISNLREVSYKDNNKNSAIRKDNKTGYTGVTLKGTKYVATIKNLEGRQLQLGSFSSLEEAVDARVIAENTYNYHKNHGKTL